MDQKWTSTDRSPSSQGANGERGIVGQAKETASTVAERARDGVSHQLAARKGRAVGTMTDLAGVIRETSGKLNDAGPLPELAERAADGIERVARMVESRDVKDVISSVERFARREPALFLGGALAVGLAAGRFLKSSTPRPEHEEARFDDRDWDVDTYDYGGGGRRFAAQDEDIAFGTGPGSVGGGAPGATQGAPGVRAEAAPLGGGIDSARGTSRVDVPSAPARDPNGTPGRS